MLPGRPGVPRQLRPGRRRALGGSKNKRAHYNARSLKNWLESNGWVDSVSAGQDELRSGILPGAQPGDVLFYDWESSGGYSSVHTAVVVDVQNDVPIVVEQGAGEPLSPAMEPVGQ